MSRQLWKRVQSHLDLIPDGIPGPATARAVIEALGIEPPASSDWPVDGGSQFGQSELYEFYGSRGSNLARLEMPYPLRLDWDLGTQLNYFSIHAKCHDAFKSLFTKALEQYGLQRIQDLGLDRFGGCYNNRRKRGGSSWSIHAWAAAVDLYPSRNQLRWGRDRAVFGRPEYQPFWDIVEEVGLVSLGQRRNYDWMHIQAAELP